MCKLAVVPCRRLAVDLGQTTQRLVLRVGGGTSTATTCQLPRLLLLLLLLNFGGGEQHRAAGTVAPVEVRIVSGSWGGVWGAAVRSTVGGGGGGGSGGLTQRNGGLEPSNGRDKGGR